MSSYADTQLIRQKYKTKHRTKKRKPKRVIGAACVQTLPPQVPITHLQPRVRHHPLGDRDTIFLMSDTDSTSNTWRRRTKYEEGPGWQKKISPPNTVPQRTTEAPNMRSIIPRTHGPSPRPRGPSRDPLCAMCAGIVIRIRRYGAQHIHTPQQQPS